MSDHERPVPPISRLFGISLPLPGPSYPSFLATAGVLGEAVPRLTPWSFEPLLELDLEGLVFPGGVSWLPPSFERAERVEAAFAHAGLVPAPSMGEDLVDEIVEDHEAGAEPDELRRKVVDHYDAEGGAPLAAVVERLCASSHFEGREPVLRQALAAHREGLDAIAVFPLVPMIEGLLWPLLEDLSGLAPKEFKNTPYPEKAKALEKMPLWRVGFEAMACLIAFLEARLYEQWRPSDGPEALDKRLNLNRHRLAHGGLMVGTRPDTVVCFLVLESVAAVLAAADDLMARFAREQSEG